VGAYIRGFGWTLERGALISDVSRLFGVTRFAAEVRLRELGHIATAFAFVALLT
jgi:hypothetical protein